MVGNPRNFLGCQWTVKTADLIQPTNVIQTEIKTDGFITFPGELLIPSLDHPLVLSIEIQVGLPILLS